MSSRRERSDATVVTMGCRLNAYESEVMRAHARAARLDDAIIVNTCAVTAEAERQARQEIRALRRERPKARIIVTGCAAQVAPHRFAAMAEVDHVVGNAEKLERATFDGLAHASRRRVLVEDIASARVAAARRTQSVRVRAFLGVQNGCDHRCTFCIIPYGRGPSRSVPAGEVVSRVRELVEAGAKEVVLTGVDLTSYGGDLPGRPRLGRLVRQILKHVPELPRLRLSSIDQVEADTDLLTALAEEPRLMPHLHLSMQSGDDLILKRMKRRHTRAQAIEFCETARRLRPDLVFGADLIAGFPTETDAMFAKTVSLIDACGLTFLHVFPFSARPGTPAARMPQVPTLLVRERAARLRARGREVTVCFLDREIGCEREVVWESNGLGRTEHNVEITLRDNGPTGEIGRARVTGHDGRRLTGEVPA